MTYFQLFCQTFLLEWFVLVICFYRVNFGKKTLVIFLANALTHPLVVFGILKIPGTSLLTLLLTAETFAALVEALIYRRLLGVAWVWAIGASLLANIFSWEMGPRLSYIIQKWNLVW